MTDEDLTRALDSLRQPKTTFQTVERVAQMGDIAVVNYTGTAEGKPLTELAPTAKGLTQNQSFWVEIGGGGFIPGFGDQLQGGKAGEKRTVTVDFPADFVAPALSDACDRLAREHAAAAALRAPAGAGALLRQLKLFRFPIRFKA